MKKMTTLFSLLAVLGMAVFNSSCAEVGIDNEFCLLAEGIKFSPPDAEELKVLVEKGEIDYPIIYDVNTEIGKIVPDLSKDGTIADIEIKAHITEVEIEALEGIDDFSFIKELKLFVADPYNELPEKKILNYTYAAGDDDGKTLTMTTQEELDLAKYLQIVGPLNFKLRIKGRVPMQKWKANLRICLAVNSTATVDITAQR